MSNQARAADAALPGTTLPAADSLLVTGRVDRLAADDTAAPAPSAGTSAGASSLLDSSVAAPETPATPALQPSEDPGTDIVVTGTRIVKDGFSAPTPVAVLSSVDIRAQAPANLSNFVNQLPAVTTGSTSSNSSGSLSNGIAGINSVNLRGLGASRTLVLIDGQRSVASSVGGIVDVNTIPQDLVERVEVVTGGASAQYGSDAVGGVVNFILNKRMKGFHLAADSGITTYGDAFNFKVGGSGGFTALDGRLHVVGSGEFFRQIGVDTINRSWNNTGYFQIANPAYTTTNGQPLRLVGSGFGPGTYTAGGLVASGPLRGTYFLGNGSTGTLNYGTFNSTSTPYMIGGDYQTTLAGHVGTNSLAPDESRLSTFMRAGFDVTPDTELFVQASWNRYIGQSYYQQTPSTGVTIQRDNAYLQSNYPAVVSAMTAANVSSLSIGTSNAGFPVPGSHNRRDVGRLVVGGSGKFSIGGHDWRWDAYFQHGLTKAHEGLINTWNTQRMALAQDAVLSGGQIVCRSTLTNPTNGCVPIDRLGTTGPSAEALAYIYGNQPYRNETVQEDVGSVSFNGDLFKVPAGTVSLAFGGEWRREGITGYVPQEFQPQVNATTGVTTNVWLYGNYLPNFGHYHVKEGFAELNVPLFKGANIDAAVRGTDYSTSGYVTTYKVGGTWAPTRDIKFRGTYSHDIRAPNLQELFAAGTARTNTVNLPSNAPFQANSSPTYVESTIGNPNLKPEKANTWTAGAVLTPSFAPGLSLSFDYYDIRIKDAIGSITSQNTVDFCYAGLSTYCNNIVYSGGALSSIVIQPFNFASQHERGFDIEAGYRMPMSRISPSIPGTFSLKAQATHYIENVVDNGIFPVDYAGVNGGSLSGTYNAPKWVYRISTFYEVGKTTLNFVVRGFSDGVYGNDYVQCTSGCPAYANANDRNRYITINNNEIPGAIYMDASLMFKLKPAGRNATLTFVVNNLANVSPVLIGNGPSGNNVPAYSQTNRSLYDVMGRTFRIAARMDF
ncbi:MAG: TonB-dependent receptor [Sphingomonadales bacterium]|nr:TonB-dependent receptor [Sphingomonadales bacterium]MDE2171093.1 TonB-dependent receptor [Sphingomonadales bacterium]